MQCTGSLIFGNTMVPSSHSGLRNAATPSVNFEWQSCSLDLDTSDMLARIRQCWRSHLASNLVSPNAGVDGITYMAASVEQSTASSAALLEGESSSLAGDLKRQRRGKKRRSLSA